MGVKIEPTNTGFNIIYISDFAEINKVIFNDPATVVIWGDGTKTVVKCQPGDTYLKETGLALCIAKKYLGNKSNFNEVFKKWIPEEDEVNSTLVEVNGIRVGDKVQIFNSGEHYSSYDDWVYENVNRLSDQRKWYGFTSRPGYLKNGDIGVVKAIAPHGTQEKTLAYVEICGICYIIGFDGIAKFKEG